MLQLKFESLWFDLVLQLHFASLQNWEELEICNKPLKKNPSKLSLCWFLYVTIIMIINDKLHAFFMLNLLLFFFLL